MPRKKEMLPEDYNSPFPSRLREIMSDLGKTQQDVADAIGKTRQAVGYYTDGSSSPDWKTIVALAKYFGVSADWLLGLSQVKSPDVEIQSISQYTGLSEESISILHEWNNPFGIPKLLDSIIGNRYADSLFETLVDLLDAVSCQECEMEMHVDKLLEIEEQLNKEFDDHFEIIGISDRIDLLRSRITRLWEGIVDEIVAEERGHD